MDLLTLALAKQYTDNKVGTGGSSGPGAQVQADWSQNDQSAPDYIKNRLAWTEPGEIITYTFDGNLEGKEYIYLEEESTDAHKNYLVKIADEAIPLDNFEGLDLYTGITQKFQKNMLSIESSGTSWAATPGTWNTPMIISAEGVEIFGSALFGTYVFYSTEKLEGADLSSFFVSAVYYSTPEIVHKLDPKYLPDGGFGYEEEKVILADVELSLGSSPSDPSEGIIRDRIGLEAGKTYTVVLDSGTYSCVCKRITYSNDEVLYLGNPNPFGTGELANTGESFLIHELREDDTLPYITDIIDLNKGTKCIVYSGGEIHGIDPKFLPEGGFGWTENTEGSLTFDGNLDGKEVIPAGNIALIKISNDAIDLANVKEIDIMFVFKDQLTPGPTLTADDIILVEPQLGTQCLVVEDMPFIISCTKDTIIDETTEISISAGTWIIYQAEDVADDGMYVSAIHFGNKVDHKIDPKFLPDGGVGYEEDAVKLVEVELVSQDIAYGQVGFTTINQMIGLEDGKEYIVQTNSGTFISLCSKTVLPKSVIYILGNPRIMNVQMEDTGESYFIMEAHDIDGQIQTWFYDANNGTKMTVCVRGEVHKIDPKYYDRLAWTDTDGTVHKLDSKYLPQDLANGGLKYLRQLIQFILNMVAQMERIIAYSAFRNIV